MKELTILYLYIIVTLVVELVAASRYAAFFIALSTGQSRETCNNTIYHNVISSIGINRYEANNGIENPCQCNVTVSTKSTYIQLMQYDQGPWNAVAQVRVLNQGDKFVILFNKSFVHIKGSNNSVLNIDLRSKDYQLRFDGNPGHADELRCKMFTDLSMVDPVIIPTSATTPRKPIDVPVTPLTRSTSTLLVADKTTLMQPSKAHIIPTILIVTIILVSLVIVTIAIVLITIHKMRGYICTKKEEQCKSHYEIVSQNENSILKDVPFNNNMNQNVALKTDDKDISNTDHTYINVSNNSKEQGKNNLEQTEYAEIQDHFM